MLIPISKLIPHSFVDQLYSSENFKNKGKKKIHEERKRILSVIQLTKLSMKRLKLGCKINKHIFSF